MNYNRAFFIVIFGFLLCYEIFIERMPFNKIIVQYKVEMYCMIFKFKFLFTVLCICLCFQSKLSLLESVCCGIQPIKLQSCLIGTQNCLGLHN